MRMSRGFSLLEMMVGLGLLFLSSTLVMNMFLAGAQATRAMETGYLLEQLAQEKLDELWAQPLSVQPYDGQSGSFPERPDYTFQWKVQAAGEADFNHLEMVVTGPGGRRRSLSVLRANREPVPPPPPPASPAPPAPEPGEPDPPVAPDFEGLGCLACHAGPYPSAPAWTWENLAASAQNAGFGEDLEGYIYQSITAPDLYAVPNYGVAMEGLELDDEEAAAIAAWLADPENPRPLPDPSS